MRVLSLTGRLGQQSVSTLASVVDRALACGCCRLVIDLEGVDYVSSAGIGALRAAAERVRHADGVLVVTGVAEPVRLTLELDGLMDELVIAIDRKLAVARAAGSFVDPGV